MPYHLNASDYRIMTLERYQNCVVQITGAGDMAKAAALRLLSEGARVALTDFSQAALDEAIAEISAEGWSYEHLMGISCDVRSQADCDGAVSAILERWGKIDTLVATAGIIRHAPIDELSEKDWQDVIDINLSGVFHSIKAAVPHMKSRQHGHIVVISSIGGRTGREVGVNYAASKAGLNGLAINLGYTLAPWKINVNSIAPGPLNGKMFATMSPERIEALSNGIPLGRIGELSEIAAAIAYIGSDEAAWATGEVFDINGGLQF